MKRILFVDDDPNVLNGLKRSLWSMRKEWNMAFAPGGEEALKALEQAAFDVVVSDMRMPGMDGTQLQDEVLRRYPHIVRIILSGQPDQEMIFHSISATHQFLAKPCGGEQLKATIQRAFSLRDVLKSDSLRRLVAGMQTVPSLPTLFGEIKEAASEMSSLKAIEAIISKDLGMTAKILQLVNSSYFGVSHDISTVERAVTFLGLKTMQTLVLSVHIFSQFSKKDVSTFHFDQLWANSIATGALARAIAKAEGYTQRAIDQVYTAGLLHDVGIVVLATNAANRYGAVLADASAKNRAVWEAEQSEFGATHAEVGACLLGLWGLSDPIVEAVAYHHRPGDYAGEVFGPVTAVHVANALQQECSQQANGHVLPKLDMGYLDKLQLTDRVPCWRKLAGLSGKEMGNG